MVKLVKEEPYWRFVCQDCEARLEAEVEDVFLSIDRVYFVQCPACRFKTEVPAMLLAKQVKQYAQPYHGMF